MLEVHFLDCVIFRLDVGIACNTTRDVADCSLRYLFSHLPELQHDAVRLGGADVCDDPHITGLRGQKIDWSRINGEWYIMD